MRRSCGIVLAFFALTGATSAAPSGKGTPFEKESWGVRLTVPGGWRAGENDGLLLIGGESEAGLIVVRFVPQTLRK